MKNLSLAILDKWLPSKWPRLVAGAAVSLITGTFALSEWGQKIGLSLTQSEMSQLRREGIPWLCVVALALIHYLVVREKNSLLNLQPWKLHKKENLSVGQYFDVLTKDGKKVIRITLKEISKQMMPLPYTNIGKGTHKQIEAETATLSFDDFLSILPGQAVKPIPVTMPYTESSFIFSKNANSEEANSVFSFAPRGMNSFSDASLTTSTLQNRRWKLTCISSRCRRKRYNSGVETAGAVHPATRCTTKEPMKKAKRLIFILMLSAFLAACRIDANQLLQSEEILTIQVYKSSGTGITTKEIKKGDETFTRFQKWLEENEKGWEPSPVTFVPSVEVRGKKFVFNFHPRRAILNFQSPDGKYHQYVKDIAEADFQYLLSK